MAGQIGYGTAPNRICRRCVAYIDSSQRGVVELLREIRGLLRLVAARLRAFDGRLDRVDAWLLPLAGRGERLARHLRN